MADLKSDVRSLVSMLVKDHGCEKGTTSKGHIRLSRPGYRPITVSHSPSDPRAMQNIKSDVRRYLGIDI